MVVRVLWVVSRWLLGGIRVLQVVARVKVLDFMLLIPNTLSQKCIFLHCNILKSICFSD